MKKEIKNAQKIETEVEVTDIKNVMEMRRSVIKIELETRERRAKREKKSIGIKSETKILRKTETDAEG